MLTGYNTDVSYGGEIFHVQTEDKGIHSPIILSLVYRAGTILAAKRTPYSNLIQNGIVDEAAVYQMLTRQHQILVAAIQSGKSEKLVELSRHQNDSRGTTNVATAAAGPTIGNRRSEPIEARRSPETPVPGNLPKSASSVLPAATPVSPREFDAISFDQIISGFLQHPNHTEPLRIELIYPSKFRSGDEVTVRVAIFLGGHKPLPGAQVQVQVLGTKFTAQTWQTCSDTQGQVSLQIKVPKFTAGAAALIFKATAPNGQDTEAKFMISLK
ncbi:MAG: hypothetical protein U0Y68_03230 [Blastocatellia bacterium]